MTDTTQRPPIKVRLRSRIELHPRLVDLPERTKDVILQVAVEAYNQGRCHYEAALRAAADNRCCRCGMEGHKSHECPTWPQKS